MSSSQKGKRVWKWEIGIDNEQYLAMPLGAELLDVQVQAGEPCLWALIDPEAATVKRCIQTRGTGHLAEGMGPYVGTYQLMQGDLIFHVFDGGEVDP